MGGLPRTSFIKGTFTKNVVDLQSIVIAGKQPIDTGVNSPTKEVDWAAPGTHPKYDPVNINYLYVDIDQWNAALQKRGF